MSIDVTVSSITSSTAAGGAYSLRFPKPPSWFNGDPTSKGKGKGGEEREGKRNEGRGGDGKEGERSGSEGREWEETGGKGRA